MKSSTAFGVLALVASVTAHEHQHDKFHRRAVDTGDCQVTYQTVTSYGEWGLVPASSSSAPSSSSSVHSSSTSSSSSVAATSTSTSSSSSSSAPPPPPSTTSSVSTSSSTSSTSTPPPPATTSSSTSSSSPPPPPPPPSSTSTSTSSTPEPTTVAPTVQYKAAVTATSAAAETSAAAASTSSQSSSNSGTSGSISANGNKWAFCYTPYTTNGGCKSASEVSSDIASLKGKGFTTIRTYANDCDGLSNIGSACRAHGMKMLVGINIDGSGISGASGAVASTKSWGASNWDIVSMVIVGNEAIFNGWATSSGLASFITDVKGQLKSAGYTGPVTTTEPLNVIEAHGSDLCPVVDVIGANIHPYFDTTVSALLAGPFVAKQLSDLSGVCSGSKEAYILETGWPTSGDSNGLAVPGVVNQKLAIDSIMTLVGGKASVFSYQNDAWKAPGALGVEQSWGCADLFA